MAIDLRDFGNYRLNVPLNINCDPETSRRIHNKEPYIKSKEKWWNKIIPKAEEGQVIPNGISYKYSNNEYRTRFAVILRICNFKICLEFKKDKDFDGYCYMEGEKRDNGYSFKLLCLYR